MMLSSTAGSTIYYEDGSGMGTCRWFVSEDELFALPLQIRLRWPLALDMGR